MIPKCVNISKSWTLPSKRISLCKSNFIANGNPNNYSPNTRCISQFSESSINWTLFGPIIQIWWNLDKLADIFWNGVAIWIIALDCFLIIILSRKIAASQGDVCSQRARTCFQSHVHACLIMCGIYSGLILLGKPWPWFWPKTSSGAWWHFS